MSDDRRRLSLPGRDPAGVPPQCRRAFLAGVAALAGGTVLAEILPGFSASAAPIAIHDQRLKTANIHWSVDSSRELHGFMAIPAKARGRQPAVLLVHDARGLTDYMRDVARRIALAGFVVCAPDFLSTIEERTPADERVARAMIASLDPAQTMRDAVATIRWLGLNRYASGKVGAVGFGWGAHLIDQVASTAGEALTAAVCYDDPTPERGEAAGVKAAMLLHYAGQESRAEAVARPWINALRAAGVSAQAYFYESANRADHEGGHSQYSGADIALAWDRTVAFLREQLQ